jgi:Flp pilus assembly protein CpaB
MAAPTPRPRASGGGTPLIVLGIVLALVTAVLVFFLTTGVGGNNNANGQGVPVVMAAQSLTPGMVLSATQSGNGYMRVADVFHVEHLPAGAVPADAYTFTSWSDLGAALNNQIIVAPLYAGDILRHNDGRMAPLGAGPAHSLTNHNPAAIPDGDVLMAIQISSSPGLQIGVQEGDHVDLLATECVQAIAASGGCQVAQTTLQNLTVYMVSNTMIYLAVTHQDALVLKLLVETAKLDLVLRKPGDTATVTTQPIDTAWIISHFGFTPP